MKFNSDLCINKYIAKETCLSKERMKENKPKCKPVNLICVRQIA